MNQNEMDRVRKILADGRLDAEEKQYVIWDRYNDLWISADPSGDGENQSDEEWHKRFQANVYAILTPPTERSE